LRHVLRRRTVAQSHERVAAVVLRVRHHFARTGARAATAEAAAPLCERRRAQPEHDHDGSDRGARARRHTPRHRLSFFACRSRIALVLSARSVSSFSICASYCAWSIPVLRSFSAAICWSIASFSSTSCLIGGLLVSPGSAPVSCLLTVYTVGALCV